MKKKTKIRLGLGIVILFVCIGIVCIVLINKRKSEDSQASQPPTETTQALDQSVSTTPTAVSTSPVTTESPVVGLYTNKDFGFTLVFAEEWNGYTVAPGEKKDIAGFVGSLEFKLPDVSQVPLTVYIFDKQSDESILSQLHATQISKGSKYLYGYSTWENSPSESVKITDKSIANLIKTFKLI